MIDRYRSLFGERDQLGDLSLDGMMTMGRIAILFIWLWTEKTGGLYKTQRISMDLASISFSKGLCHMELFRIKAYH
jgi:hypothetical protein